MMLIETARLGFGQPASRAWFALALYRALQATYLK